MPQENEKCCSYSRTGAVGSSFLLSWTGLHVSEGLTALPSIQIIQIASDGALGLSRKGPTGRLIREELIICATVADVSNGELYAR
jgi:hypothetical protein